MARAKISLLAPDCTIHSLARTRILAQLMCYRYLVDVVAPVFPGDDDAYSSFAWPGSYIPVAVRKLPGFGSSVGDLMDALSGDLVYASKARATSLGVALLARLRRRVPVIVDIDDREIYQCYPYSYHASKNLLLSFRDWSHPNSYPLTLLMDRLVQKADHVTSVSSYFQRLYGGTVVPQAVDTDLFNPELYDRKKLRLRWGLDGYKVVLFLGRPLPHKGLDEIVRAVRMSRHAEARVVVVGGWTPYAESIRTMDRVIFLGPQPFSKAPAFLAMADVVMVPQRRSPLALGQMPVKVPEAMAMGVPIIGSDISDIADQLGDAGIVVPPGDVAALTVALDRLLDDPVLASSMGRSGRLRCERHYAVRAVRPTIESVLHQYVG